SEKSSGTKRAHQKQAFQMRHGGERAQREKPEHETKTIPTTITWSRTRCRVYERQRLVHQSERQRDSFTSRDPQNTTDRKEKKRHNHLHLCYLLFYNRVGHHHQVPS
ncbi:unnamed protein product, partial [Ectocarpus fasciculatus]